MGEIERFPLVHGISKDHCSEIERILARTTDLFHLNQAFSRFQHDPNRPPGFVDVRGMEYGDNALSIAFYPAGVLTREDRPRFRKEVMDGRVFQPIIAHIRRELYACQLEHVLVQHGGTSTIDLTTTTKGITLARVRREVLNPHDFFVYLGDTVTSVGNDGSTVEVAEFSVQLGEERDTDLLPPNGHFHAHSPTTARQGGAAAVIDLVTRAARLASLNDLWIPRLPS